MMMREGEAKEVCVWQLAACTCILYSMNRPPFRGTPIIMSGPPNGSNPRHFRGIPTVKSTRAEMSARSSDRRFVVFVAETDHSNPGERNELARKIMFSFLVARWSGSNPWIGSMGLKRHILKAEHENATLRGIYVILDSRGHDSKASRSLTLRSAVRRLPIALQESSVTDQQ
jgi:hypothetical protein